MQRARVTMYYVYIMKKLNLEKFLLVYAYILIR